MREQHDIAYTSTLVSLSQMLHSIDDHPDLESPSSLTEGMTSEEILQLSLEAYLRRTMRPTPFKVCFHNVGFSEMRYLVFFVGCLSSRFR
jgi:hypothetical protein